MQIARGLFALTFPRATPTGARVRVHVGACARLGRARHCSWFMGRITFTRSFPWPWWRVEGTAARGPQRSQRCVARHSGESEAPSRRKRRSSETKKSKCVVSTQRLNTRTATQACATTNLTSALSTTKNSVATAHVSENGLLRCTPNPPSSEAK